MNAQLDALTLAASLRKRLVDFALESGYLRRADLQAAAKRLWSGEPGAGGLIGDLWIESATASQLSPQSAGSLTAAGQFPPALRDHLHRTGAMPSDRLLYTHQAEAVGATHGSTPDARPAIVVTAGTEHNTRDLIPIAPACLAGAPIPEDVQTIFDEGACVIAAHQYLSARGETGFVDAQNVPNPTFATADERIAYFAKLGRAVIAAYRE